MTSVLSNYAGGAALQQLLRSGTCYLALHTSDPTVLGLLTTEVSGGGYSRQVVTFGAPSGKTCVSTNAQVFPGMPVVVVTYLAVWDSSSAGNLLFTIQLSTPITTFLSGQFQVAPGDVAVSL